MVFFRLPALQLFALAMMLASCGRPATRCGPTTCLAGCCDESGQCVNGTTSATCGVRGATCQACALGQVCDLSGACTNPLGVGGGTAGGSSGGGQAGGGDGGGQVSCPRGCVSGSLCLLAGSVNQNDAQCGTAGVVCYACRPPNGSCQNGFCVPPFTGGGPTGGGGPSGGGVAGGGGAGGGRAGGAGGGSGSGCQTLVLGGSPVLPNSVWRQNAAQYSPISSGAFNEAEFVVENGIGTNVNFLNFELVRGGTAVSVPFSGTFRAGYNTCTACFRFGENCSADTTNCVRTFLAVSGDVTYPTATASSASGTFSGSVSNVRLVEWDFTMDAAKTNPRCYLLGQASFSVSWP